MRLTIIRAVNGLSGLAIQPASAARLSLSPDSNSSDSELKAAMVAQGYTVSVADEAPMLPAKGYKAV